MRISELGHAANVGTETIRYYEKEGLLPEPNRAPNGYRTYTPVHLERLAFIRHCRMLDIPLTEIKLLLDFSKRHINKDCSDINQLIDKQLTRVRARLVSCMHWRNNFRHSGHVVMKDMLLRNAVFYKN